MLTPPSEPPRQTSTARRKAHTRRTERFLEHALVVSDSHRVLELAVRHERDLELIEWNQGDGIRAQARIPGASKVVRTTPDANFMQREWLDRLDIGTLIIEPGSPCENGHVESFSGELRDEHNTFRPHRSLGYGAPAPEAIAALPPGCATLRPPAADTGLPMDLVR